MSPVSLEGCHLNSGCGFPAPSAEIFFLQPYATLTLGGIEFTISKTVILVALVAVVVMTFFLAAFRSPKLVPGKLQSVGEMGYTFVRDQIDRKSTRLNSSH